MYEELDSNLSRNSSFGWDPLVMNEKTYEHRLRSFLANQPKGEATFADIVHSYNETLKISRDYIYNLMASLCAFSLPIPFGCWGVLHPYSR